ncbi:MAG: OmcA/MtrC family decaheme c-type cytochrome [Gammaproteobacteria bacterium]
MTRLTGRISGMPALLALACFSLVLSGCDGSDGRPGEDGAPGPAGPEGPTGPEGSPGVGIPGLGDIVIGNGSLLTATEAEVAGRISAEITAVTAATPPVIEFTLKTQRGGAVLGLAPSALNLTLAKLAPSGDGRPAEWVSYINRIQTGTAGPIALTQALQANTENGAAGTLQELGQGNYRYTFATNPANVTTPVPVAYDPTNTHRIGFELRFSAPGNQIFPDNPVIDFVPATGAVLPLQKLVAATENCSACHERLELHGGPRVTVEYCVTCHNPSTLDPDSGSKLDMAHMVHSIHKGMDRAIPYQVFGFGGALHDYSEVTYPQSVLFCENCHAESEAAPAGDAWKTTAAASICSGCHIDGLLQDTPDPVTGISALAYQHSFGQVSDGVCVSCHAPGRIINGQPIGPEEAHLQGVKEAVQIGREQFAYEVIEVTNALAGQQPVITFAVNNPSTGTRYDITTDAPFNQGSASLTLDIAWNTSDYSNELSGSAPAQPLALNLAFLKANATRNADGSYTVTAPGPMPATVTGGVGVALEGRPSVAVPSTGALTNIPVKGATAYFGTPRREIVSIDSCLNCHESLALHGNNRADNVQLCVVCHNPDATDVRRRARTVDNVVVPYTWDDPSPLDGKGEESIDMRYMIHALHAAQNVVFGFGNTAHDYRDITYPQAINNCGACHKPGTYFPVPVSARSVTINTGANRADWRDDVAMTPNAAACWSCHQAAPDFIAIPTRAHIEQNGGYIPSPTDASVNKEVIEARSNSAYIEACTLCHGPGGTADVEVAHGLK